MPDAEFMAQSHMGHFARVSLDDISYTRVMKKLLLIILFIFSVPLVAQETLTDEELENAPTESLDVGEEALENQEEPLELDKFTVTGEQFTYEQETALRMVRQALKRNKSLKREDWDILVCWYRKPAGTHRTHLECARNGDLIALKPDRMMGNTFLGGRGVGAGYGTIMRSNRPVNKKTFEAMLNDLPGSDDFDQEFVAKSLAGQRLPRDVPSDTELDAFAEAYKIMGELEKAGADEDAMIQAIESQDLTIGRYNRLVDLVETYQSIENEVAYRLGTFKKPQE
jgi:hypothetical protein